MVQEVGGSVKGMRRPAGARWLEARRVGYNPQHRVTIREALGSGDAWNKRRAVYTLGFLVLTAIGTIRIVLTYPVFFQTNDEPYHVAVGMAWWDQGGGSDFEHPPLARAAAVAGLYLRGFHSMGISRRDAEGNAILRSRGSFPQNLAIARAGILPFFVFACWLVWFWARRAFGEPAGLAAAFVFSSLPPVLGHAGLATTDMAITAFLPAAAYAFLCWLRSPTTHRSLLLGLSAGLALLSKFSTPVFLLACVLVLLGLFWWMERPSLTAILREAKRRVRPLLISAATAFLVVWAGYRFALTPLKTRDDRPHFSGTPPIARVLARHEGLREAVNSLLEMPVPAGELFRGFEKIRAHNKFGHESFLLGEFRSDGWWYFFPVVLAVKTPLAVFLLVIAGVVFLLRAPPGRARFEGWAPVACAIAILVVVLPSRITIGVRHILPIYSFLAVVAGYGLARLFDRARSRRLAGFAACALSLWLAASSILAHPDYLAYFNELAGAHPERIVVDSDLDWGQDLWRLSRRLKELGVRDVALAYFGSERLDGQGLPRICLLEPYRPVTGWIAISEFSFTVEADEIRRTMGADRSPYFWLEDEPYLRVGKSIRLYFLPAHRLIK